MAVQATEGEHLLLAPGQSGDVRTQAQEQALGMCSLVQGAPGLGDVMQDGVGHILDQGVLAQTACTQVIPCQIARSLEEEGLEMFDRASGQGPSHPQPGVLQQVFGRAGVADHALQCAQQGAAMADEQGVESWANHGKQPAEENADGNVSRLLLSRKECSKIFACPAGAGKYPPDQLAFTSARQLSSMRLEKPHSLSYQAMTLSILPLVLVWFASKIDDSGLWLKSIDTSGRVL